MTTPLGLRVQELERMIDTLSATLRREIGHRSRIEDRLDKMVRHGKVTDVDTQKQLARIEIGNKNGVSLKSPWVPYAQFAGPDGQGSGNGEFKFHNPPAVGQQMSLFAPNGEFRQAVILPFTWYDKAVSPSQASDQHVVTYGQLKDVFKKNERTMSIGDAVSFDMTTNTATITAGTIVLASGDIRLGGAGASRPLALKDTVTSDGATNVDNLSTAVKAV